MQKIFSSSSNTWLRWLLGLSVASGIFLLIRSLRKNAVVLVPQEAPQTLVSNLAIYLAQSGFDSSYVPYIIALSAMESGRWTSRLWITYNNPWGMRYPEQRETSAIGKTIGIFEDEPEGFAIYFSGMFACKDFVYYLQAKRAPKSFARFYDFIAFIQSKGYEPNLSTYDYFTRCLNAVA